MGLASFPSSTPIQLDRELQSISSETVYPSKSLATKLSTGEQSWRFL